MFHIILYQPEIPPNTGNIIRLCANNGCQLHLIHPLGFSIDEKQCRRAGLDYQMIETISEYASFSEFVTQKPSERLFACSTKGTKAHSAPSYAPGDGFIFGPETRGLPKEILEHEVVTEVIRIPMLESSRSLNLSNATAIITYEAWRQLDYDFTG